MASDRISTLWCEFDNGMHGGKSWCGCSFRCRRDHICEYYMSHCNGNVNRRRIRSDRRNVFSKSTWSIQQIIQSRGGYSLPVYISVYRFITIPRAFHQNEDALDLLRFLVEREREKERDTLLWSTYLIRLFNRITRSRTNAVAILSAAILEIPGYIEHTVRVHSLSRIYYFPDLHTNIRSRNHYLLTSDWGCVWFW